MGLLHSAALIAIPVEQQIQLLRAQCYYGNG